MGCMTKKKKEVDVLPTTPRFCREQGSLIATRKFRVPRGLIWSGDAMIRSLGFGASKPRSLLRQGSRVGNEAPLYVSPPGFMNIKQLRIDSYADRPRALSRRRHQTNANNMVMAGGRCLCPATPRNGKVLMLTQTHKYSRRYRRPTRLGNGE